MTERDDELARLFDGSEPPPHRDGFWDDVRADLDGRPAVLAMADRLRRPPMLLAAAAIVLVALVGVGVVLAGDDDPVDVVTDPSPTSETTGPDPGPSSTTGPDAPAQPLRAAGEPTERGPGEPVAVDPDSRFLYLRDTAGEGGQGCEGAERQAVYVEPIDGGTRAQVLPADTLDATGRVDLWFSDDGRVAARSMCEAFGNEVVTATVAPDGTFTDVETLTIPHLDAGGEDDVDLVADVAWTPDGQLVAAVHATLADGSEHRHLYSFPPGPSEATDLGQDGAIQVEATNDGRIVTLDVDGTVRVDGEELARFESVRELSVSSSGSVAMVSVGGSDGLVAVDLASGRVRRLGLVGAVGVTAVADDAVVASVGDGAVFPTTALTIVDEGVHREEIGLLAFPPPVVTPDGGRYFGTVYVDDATRTVIYETRLTR